MAFKSAVVLAIDGLGTGYLGPYGNTWTRTLNWNRLAGEALLFEFALSDSPQLAAVYRSYWRGSHALSPDRPTADLAELLGQAGVHTVLLTDDRSVAELPGAAGFEERIVLPASQATTTAPELEQTQLAQLFSAALDELQRCPQPFLLWVHAQGMHGPWDAPLEFRNQFPLAGDPLPPDSAVPPHQRLIEPYDPDELLGMTHAYAGQISLLDVCLGVLLDALDPSERPDPPLLIVTSPRGYPLGEHGLVGHEDDWLYGESLQVPCLVRVPNEIACAHRCHDFVQPSDLYATLLDWLDVPLHGELPWGRSWLPLIHGQTQTARDRACAIAGESIAIRTPAWFLVRKADHTRELFAKPDDRWEINEVANRCGQIAEELEASFDQFSQMTQTSQASDLPPLPESLTTVHR